MVKRVEAVKASVARVRARAKARARESRLMSGLDALVANSGVIVGLPHRDQYRLFSLILLERGVEMSKLLTIARLTCKAKILTQLVDHAIKQDKVDELWCVMLRISRKWAAKEFICTWDNTKLVQTAMCKLMNGVSYSLTEEMALALNPINELWFADMADWDAYWNKVIDHEIACGKWDEVINSLVCAGQGFSVVDEEKFRREFPGSEKFWAELQNARDYFGGRCEWRMYGKVSDFDALTCRVWNAHVECNLLPSSAPDRKVVARHIRFAPRVRYGQPKGFERSLIGLLARGASRSHVAKLRFNGSALNVPTLLDDSVLSESMAKFQQLVLLYQDRSKKRRRPVINTVTSALTS